MAYAAVISLKHTIQRLLNSSQIWIVSSTREIIEYAYKELKSLQEVLKRLDRRSSSSSSSGGRLNALDGQIREVVHKLEDFLEFHESNQLLSKSQGYGDEDFPHILSLDLEEVSQEINTFKETVKKMKKEYIKELDNPLPEEEDDVVPSRIDFGGNTSNVVGLSHDELMEIKYQLTERRSYEFGVVSIVGMAGTGRTILAKAVFEQPLLSKVFNRRTAWVTIGPKYQLKEIMIAIISQIDPEGYDNLLITGGNEKIAEQMYTSLKGRRYLIVLDDIWDTQAWDYLRTLFPDDVREWKL